VGELSHFDASGRAAMVDISAKQNTRRTATASAFVELSAPVLAALPANPKGNPLEVARFAGIQAAKRTSDLIPMCHPLALTHVDVGFDGCLCCRADGLRYDQGTGQGDCDPRRAAGKQVGRQERGFST
jgi:molybdenum cofactor biosynthesis protein MoaC